MNLHSYDTRTVNNKSNLSNALGHFSLIGRKFAATDISYYFKSIIILLANTTLITTKKGQQKLSMKTKNIYPGEKIQ